MDTVPSSILDINAQLMGKLSLPPQLPERPSCTGEIDLPCRIAGERGVGGGRRSAIFSVKDKGTYLVKVNIYMISCVEI